MRFPSEDLECDWWGGGVHWLLNRPTNVGHSSCTAMVAMGRRGKLL